ncbi:MAG: Calvin cycle protein CP12 [Synechococcales bacterium]|nr:Calvin cycle protein CP12 [Synechococcales bacterium]
MKTPTYSETNFQEIERNLQEAIEQARRACEQDASSTDCATAWDIVEEMQAEISHRRHSRPKSNFQVYCDEHPDAAECRMYDL